MLTSVSLEGPEQIDTYTGRIPTHVGRLAVPPFILDLDLDREPGTLGTLGAGGLALLAAALDPKIFGPGMPVVQTALRSVRSLPT